MPKSLLSASLLVSVFFGIDKIVGLGRQLLVARAFGLGAELDAFNAANNLPDTLISLLSGGALALAFIPVLTATLDREGRDRAWELFSLIANLAFGVTAAFALLLAVFAEPLVKNVIVPGFTPAQHTLVVNLMRLDLIAALLFSISGLTMSALQAQQHFLLPALAPILYNVGQIVGVTLLRPLFGIYGLAYGVLLGAVLHLAVQAPGLWRYGFRWTPRLTLAHAGVQHVLRLMGPRLLTVFCLNLIFIANDNLASGLTTGAISALAYGWLIMQLPETVIGTAAGTALLPTLAELVTRGERAELQRLLRRSIGIILALTLPVTLLSWFLIQPAVKLVFEGRAFTAENSELVILAARMFLLGLTGHCLVEIAARTFYAHQDALTPLGLALITLVVFISVGALLRPALGFAALALANTLAFTLEALLMLGLLWRRKIL